MLKSLFFTIILILTSFTAKSDEANNSLKIKEEIQNDAPSYQEEKYYINENNLQNHIKRSQILYEENKIPQSQKLLLQIIEFTKDSEFIEENIISLLKLGNINFNLEQNIESAKYYYEAINLSLHNNYKNYLGILYSKLSYLYISSDLSFAKTYLELAITENTASNNTKLLAENYYNIALIYKNLGLLKQAIEAKKYYQQYYKKAGKPLIYKISINNAESNEFKINLTNQNDYGIAEYAYIQILNKIDGFTYLFENQIGSKINFKTIEITTNSCLKSSPHDLPENMMLMQVREKNQNQEDQVIFNGWMFSSSPSLNSLEHPIYDIKLIDCVTQTI